MTLIADGFLAGSLLTLLLPVALLIALVYWYVKFIRKVPETEDGKATVAGPNPGPGAAPAAAANPVAGTASGAAERPETSHPAG